MIENADIANGLLDQYEALAQLLDGLDAAAWNRPTRCDEWAVRDVAGHVVGLASDAASGMPGSRTADEQAAAMRGHPPAELAVQLRGTVAIFRGFLELLDAAAWDGPSGVPDLTLAQGVLGLWFDAYVHADDINAALGHPADRGAGLDGSVAMLALRLTQKGWGPATLALDGLPQVDIGAGGPKVTGDPHHFVLVASGRADPATLDLDASVNVYA